MKILKISLVTFILLSTVQVYGLVSLNKSECSFLNQCDDNNKDSYSALSSGDIKTTIVLGASSYLSSQKNFTQFMNYYELSDIYGADLSAKRIAIDSAITHMESAYSYYYELFYLSYYAKYDPVVLDKLRNFDYLSFKREWNIRSEVFSDIREFLVNSDIKGAYREMFKKSGRILNQLYQFRYTLSRGIIPDINGVWILSQEYSDTLLFGQYIAMVFKSVQ